MKALITGASSGIGRDMARYLSKLGYDLVIVARRQELLEELKKDLATKVEIECMDISVEENCTKLFEAHKDIDILINNAGFGDFGKFDETDLNKEISMIDTNIKATHILTKLYVQEMKKREKFSKKISLAKKNNNKDVEREKFSKKISLAKNKNFEENSYFENYGYILNVASIAGFMSGPLMVTYYATKNYVVALSKAIQKELKKDGSKVRISVLCPGPVNTNFDNVANVRFSLKSLSSEYVAKYAIDKMLKNKNVIIPGNMMKLIYLGNKLSPACLSLEIAYHSQKRKQK